jgi:hypothetical protein
LICETFSTRGAIAPKPPITSAKPGRPLPDTNYNGESFFVRHAYFTGADEPYEELERALRAEINEEAWSALYSTKSRPFDSPKTSKIAVKGHQSLRRRSPEDLSHDLTSARLTDSMPPHFALRTAQYKHGEKSTNAKVFWFPSRERCAQFCDHARRSSIEPIQLVSAKMR